MYRFFWGTLYFSSFSHIENKHLQYFTVDSTFSSLYLRKRDWDGDHAEAGKICSTNLQQIICTAELLVVKIQQRCVVSQIFDPSLPIFTGGCFSFGFFNIYFKTIDYCRQNISPKQFSILKRSIYCTKRGTSFFLWNYLLIIFVSLWVKMCVDLKHAFETFVYNKIGLQVLNKVYLKQLFGMGIVIISVTTLSRKNNNNNNNNKQMGAPPCLARGSESSESRPLSHDSLTGCCPANNNNNNSNNNNKGSSINYVFADRGEGSPQKIIWLMCFFAIYAFLF